jgi:hypothetical protein
MTHQEVVLVRLGLAGKYPSIPAAGTYCRCWRGRPTALQNGVRPAHSQPGAESEHKHGVAAAGGGVACGTVMWYRQPHPVYQCSRNRSTVESSVSMHAHNLGSSTGV